MEYILKKDSFYKELETFASNKHLNIFFFHNFGPENQYTICFDWAPKTPSGKSNFTASCQLYDNRKSGPKKYITSDLIFDMKKQGVTTDYKLYKFLRDWVQENVIRYECEIRKSLESCEECGFCAEEE